MLDQVLLQRHRNSWWIECATHVAGICARDGDCPPQCPKATDARAPPERRPSSRHVEVLERRRAAIYSRPRSPSGARPFVRGAPHAHPRGHGVADDAHLGGRLRLVVQFTSGRGMKRSGPARTRRHRLYSGARSPLSPMARATFSRAEIRRTMSRRLRRGTRSGRSSRSGKRST